MVPILFVSVHKYILRTFKHTFISHTSEAQSVSVSQQCIYVGTHPIYHRLSFGLSTEDADFTGCRPSSQPTSNAILFDTIPTIRATTTTKTHADNCNSLYFGLCIRLVYWYQLPWWHGVVSQSSQVPLHSPTNTREITEDLGAHIYDSRHDTQTMDDSIRENSLSSKSRLVLQVMMTVLEIHKIQLMRFTRHSPARLRLQSNWRLQVLGIRSDRRCLLSNNLIENQRF